jgi:hypothetical protein
MTDRPILFSAPMVRALLAGTKTQTRRIIKPQPTYIESSGRWRFPIPTAKQHGCDAVFSASREWHEYLLPHQKPWHAVGDRLWVRETLACCIDWGLFYDAHGGIGPSEKHFLRDDRAEAIVKRYSRDDETIWNVPSIFMPRWASRITLLVDDVKVERLQDISEEDAIAEGIRRNPHGNGDQWMDYPEGSSAAGWVDPVRSYQSLWTSINGEGSWASNPWVACYRFRTILENIDYIGRAAA